MDWLQIGLQRLDLAIAIAIAEPDTINNKDSSSMCEMRKTAPGRKSRGLLTGTGYYLPLLYGNRSRFGVGVGMRCFMRARREKADVRPGHGGSVSRTTNSEDCGEAHVVPYLVRYRYLG